MSQRKPTSKAAKAKAEKDGGRQLKWKGLTITLPKDMPDVVVLDLAHVQNSDDASASFVMLENMIGPEQYHQVRSKVKKGEADIPAVSDLIRDCFAAYGASEGE